MEEFVPAQGGANGMHADTAMTREEQENDARWWITYYEMLCRKGHASDAPDLSPLYRPAALHKFQAIRRTLPHIYDGVLEPLFAALVGRSWPKFDAQVRDFLDSSQLPITLPYVPEPLMPPLPLSVCHDEALAAQASPWLDGYIQHSQRWASRAAAGFHEAVGLWVLSTIAARRVCVDMGVPIYPVLFMAMVAPSTLYTKTTAAQVGLRAVDVCGCKPLRAADRSTPQAFLRSMSGRVPNEFGSMGPEEREETVKRLAFAGQRGWYFEEWGQMLQQMTRRDSPMAEFHGLLRVLDDSNETFSSDTIQRGLESIQAPYLSLLASATPYDLAYFMKQGSPWWHDGFWPRFAFVVPRGDELPHLARRPAGHAVLPAALVLSLHQWHQRLGVPEAVIEAAIDAKGKLTGTWRRHPLVLPLHHMPLDQDTQDAYYAYNDALLQMVISAQAPPDLAACYGRFHDKALRIALLLASLENAPSLAIRYWWRGQAIAERWRGMLHQLLEMIERAVPLSRDQQLEARLRKLIERRGPVTIRDCYTHLGVSAKEIVPLMKVLVDVGTLQEFPGRQGARFGFPIETPEDLDPSDLALYEEGTRS